MKCSDCRMCVEQQLPPPNIGKVSVCKCLPPTPLLIPQGGGQVAQVAMWPVVAPDMFCFQFEPRDAQLPTSDSPLLKP